MKKHRITLVGSSCLLLVFTILILDVLAMSAYLNAVSDQRMSQRYAASISAYYAADAKASELYQQIVKKAQALPVACGLLQEQGIECQADDESLTYYIDIDASRLLKAQVKMELTDKRIIGWQVIVKDEELEQDYPLWQGEN